MKGVRIPVLVSEVLEAEASQSNTSVNSLIVSTLTKHVEWDRLAHRFGFVSIPHPALKSVIERLEASQIDDIVNHLADIVRDEIAFWFSDVSLDNYLRFTRMNAKYSDLYELEESVTNQKRALVLKHDFGKNWSELIGRLHTTSLKSMGAMEVDLRTFQNSLEIRFRVHEKP